MFERHRAPLVAVWRGRKGVRSDFCHTAAAATKVAASAACRRVSWEVDDGDTAPVGMTPAGHKETHNGQSTDAVGAR